jgi:hypothetical protein
MPAIISSIHLSTIIQDRNTSPPFKKAAKLGSLSEGTSKGSGKPQQNEPALFPDNKAASPSERLSY